MANLEDFAGNVISGLWVLRNQCAHPVDHPMGLRLRGTDEGVPVGTGILNSAVAPTGDIHKLLSVPPLVVSGSASRCWVYE